MPTPLLSSATAGDVSPERMREVLGVRRGWSASIATAAVIMLAIAAMNVRLPLAVGTVAVRDHTRSTDATLHLIARLPRTVRDLIRIPSTVRVHAADPSASEAPIASGRLVGIDELSPIARTPVNERWYRLAISIDARVESYPAGPLRLLIATSAEPIWHLMRRDRPWLTVMPRSRTAGLNAGRAL